MAADEGTPKESRGKPVDQQVSNLLGFLQGPIKQVQEWVNSGQLQSTIEQLQEQAGRAQEGVERRLRALNEVRQGMEIHVKKQFEAYQQEKKELIRRAERATGEPTTPAKTTPAESAPRASRAKPQERPSGKRAAKKSGAKRATGRKP